MTEEVEQVDRGEAEQITADPKPENKDTKKREKNPKKVAAGKKLAEYNKKAKEALAREDANVKTEILRAAEQNENIEKTYSESKSWLPELSFTTVLSIVGLGFTAFDLFMRYQEKARDGHTVYKNRIPDLSQVPKIPQHFQAPPIKVHNPQTNTQAPPLDRPKIGMM